MLSVTPANPVALESAKENTPFVPRPVLGRHDNAVSQMARLPGDRFVSVSFDETLRLWKVDAQDAVARRDGHTGGARSVACFGKPDDQTGGFAAVGSSKGNILLWDLSKPSGPEARLPTPDSSEVDSLIFSPDGKWLISGTKDGLMTVWNVSERQPVRTLAPNLGALLGMAFSTDGKRLAVVGQGSAIIIFETVKWRIVAGVQKAHPEGADTIVFSPNGRFLVTGGIDGVVRLWNATDLRAVDAFYGHNAPVIGLAYSPSGELLATGSHDRTIRLWDLRTRRELHRFEGHTHFVRNVLFSEDGNLLVSSSWDNTLRTWVLPPALAKRSAPTH